MKRLALIVCALALLSCAGRRVPIACAGAAELIVKSTIKEINSRAAGLELFAADDGLLVIMTADVPAVVGLCGMHDPNRDLIVINPMCPAPAVFVHELGHYFGLDHSENKASIMYESYRGMTLRAAVDSLLEELEI